MAKRINCASVADDREMELTEIKLPILKSDDAIDYVSNSDPMITSPIGVKASLDDRTNSFLVNEVATNA